jgi:hypothetical protein
MIHVRFSGPGIRSRQTSLSISERDHFLREAARIHCTGMSDTRAAEFIRNKLKTYRDGRWQRDRVESLPPPRLAGRIEWQCWCALKCRDFVPEERTLRLILAKSRQGLFIANET